MYSLFFFCLVIVCFVSGNKYYNHDLITKSIEDVPSDFYALPITYYTENQQTADTRSTSYFVIKQCPESRGALPYVQLNIIAPDNPTFNTSKDANYVALELSNVYDKWDESTIFATNYIYDPQNPVIYNSIGWEYNQQPQDIYLRYRAYGSNVVITLIVSYTDIPNTNIGAYKPNFILPSVAVYQELSQYIKPNKVYQVKNSEHIVFNFSVCTREAINQVEWSIFTLGISVTSDLSAPLSAFNLVLCAVTKIPNPDDCTVNNVDAIKDQAVAPLVSLQISNDEQNDLKGGTYLTVYGKGGTANEYNNFLVEVKITKG